MNFEPEIDNSDCKLCGGTSIVEVFPHDGFTANDNVEDECPHCLRREVRSVNNRLSQEMLQRFLAGKRLAECVSGST